MKKYIKFIPHFLIALIILIVFKPWFLPGLITGGDFWPYSKLIYVTKPLFLYAWDLNNFGGLGGNVSPLLWIYLNFGIGITIFGKVLGLDWLIIERLFYLFPFLAISLFSSFILFNKFIFNKKFVILSSLIFCLNTYSLMVVGGGQIAGIGMAYALAPLVLYSFIKVVDFFNSSENNFQFSIFNFQLPLLAGLLLSMQIVFDLRIAYITLTAVAVYAVLSTMNHVFSKETLREKTQSTLYLILYTFFVPGIIVFLLNAFWLLPTILNRRNPIEDLGLAYSSLEAVKFFSFAKLEDSISLLHPNWPENIFGKTGFLKPEFLALPILAFSSLLFIKRLKGSKENIYILFFALLGLLGAFLAKGANEPFGGFYLWLFDNFPGFIMFRDPTKWYTLVAISYSMLIPFTVWKIYEWLRSQPKIQILNFKFQIKSKNQILNFQNLFLLLIVFCLLYLIRPALLGQLSGTFKTTQVPQDYIKLEKFLSSQNTFSRTLWIPTIQRFGYYSNSHPAIPAQNLFKTVENTQILKKMQLNETEKFLQEAGVKYVVVPNDSQGEIFLRDRKYNNDIYQKTINNVKQIPYLKQVSGFGKIAVFEVSNPKDHFWTSSEKLDLKYQYVSPVEYKLEVKNAKIGDRIIFSENYDASWFVRDSKAKFYDWSNLISSNPHSRAFNSFSLRKAGNYSLIVYYYPQIAVNLGVIISISSLIFVISLLIFGWKLKKW